MEDIKENLQNTASTIQKMLCKENMSLEIPSELVESITERQDGEHKKAMNNVAKEFDSKLNTVRKLSAKESESLVTSTGDIVDKLAPHGIFGTKDDGHKSLKLK